MNLRSGFFSALLGIAFLVAAPASRANGLSLIFSPSTQTIGLGGTVSVDVQLAGLDGTNPQQIVSAFDFDIAYDPGIVSLGGVTFSNMLGDPSINEVWNQSSTPATGLVNVAAVSYLDDSALQALQLGTSPLTLVTLSFKGIALGTSPLLFRDGQSIGLDIKGLDNTPLEFTTVNGDIRVVPLPAALWLMASALIGLFGSRVRMGRSDL